jgi:hypothetical protein
MEESDNMKGYDLLVECEECHGNHPMGVKIELRRGPKQRMSLRAYSSTEKKMPEAIKTHIGTPVLCPVGGKNIIVHELSRIYIQPIY